MALSKSSETLPACYNIVTYKGDSWKETIALTDSENDPIDLAGSVVVMHIKKTKKSTTTVLELTDGDGMEIIGDDNNEIDVNKIIELDEATYYYDMQVTFTDASVRTILAGTFEVVQDVTEPE